jgi:hypothetical protein
LPNWCPLRNAVKIGGIGDGSHFAPIVGEK